MEQLIAEEAMQTLLTAKLEVLMGAAILLFTLTYMFQVVVPLIQRIRNWFRKDGGEENRMTIRIEDMYRQLSVFSAAMPALLRDHQEIMQKLVVLGNTIEENTHVIQETIRSIQTRPCMLPKTIHKIEEDLERVFSKTTHPERYYSSGHDVDYPEETDDHE